MSQCVKNKQPCVICLLPAHCQQLAIFNVAQKWQEGKKHLSSLLLRPKEYSNRQQSFSSHHPLPLFEGMNSGHPNTGLGHIQGEGHLPHSTSQEEHTMLSAGASAGPSTAVGVGIFHGSLTQGESSSRMLGSNSGQFGSGSGRNNSSSLGYSPLYNLHGQSTPLASLPHYPVFFPQYPASHYSPASLVTSVHYPHIESYSAVLASMGSHVQHGAHTNPQTAVSNRTSSFLPTNVTQYTHCSLSSSSSPGPVSSSVRDHSPSGTASSYASHDCDSLLSQRRDEDTEISSPQRVPGSESHHDEKNLLHSVGLSYPCRGSSGAVINESLFGDPFYKVPCGKEGSLKHRILTRPHDIPLDANIVESKFLNKGVKVEEDLLGKRTQYIGGSATTMVASTSGSAGPENQVPAAPYALGAIPANSHAQRHPSPSGILSASPSAPPYSHLPTSTFPSSLSPSHSSPNLPPHLHYPPHFVKGSIIQLANGDLKRVEDLQTEDFVSSAQVSADLKVDSSTVVRIEEHPEVGTATLGFSVGEHRVQVWLAITACKYLLFFD